MRPRQDAPWNCIRYTKKTVAKIVAHMGNASGDVRYMFDRVNDVLKIDLSDASTLGQNTVGIKVDFSGRLMEGYIQETGADPKTISVALAYSKDVEKGKTGAGGFSYAKSFRLSEMANFLLE